MRLIVALATLALLNIYVDHGIAGRWPFALAHPGGTWAIGALLFFAELAGPFGDRLGFPRLRHGRAGALIALVDWLSYFILGTMSCLMIYVFVADLATLGWLAFAHGGNRAPFDHIVLLSLVAVTLVTSLIGTWQAQARPVIRHVDIPLANLPPAFDGFTIAQISDLHLGPLIGRRASEDIVRLIDGLRPDLIALTGDFGDGRAGDLQDDLAPLGRLRAPHGVFYITGNHEYYWHAREWIAAFRQLGATVLINAHTILMKGGQSILLAGVPDYSAVHFDADNASDPRRSLEGAPPGLVRILLAHQPASYKKAAEAGFDLQLSGHTHGGQYFPFNLLIRFFQRYYRGLNRHGNMWVYVNRGAGFWGPPLRTFVPREIALLTLRRAA